MSALEGFKPRKLIIGSPFITVTNNGVSFNKSAIDKLNYPQFVRILQDDSTTRLAIQVCDENEDDKVKFAKDKHVQNVRWNYKDFTGDLQNWVNDDNLVKNGFKVAAEYLPSENALLFDFSKAQSI